ncbi:hypothetical protein G7070_11500 [Propioniciclava coleopterorum]|uniref:Uncharacterized protein n=1 Tax=Propioniciclava coleopterorum TaxID=2714937 RepID=A0A6G7Y7L4_9ACTN|nr:hypothetical protein [Propioniciclava coleopterorum]QIK72783.1 hypothetical protein G7070_11500 [Propioniciclava coleopterorum]
MQFYARPSWRLARQIAADAFVLLWCVAWWFAGRLTDGVIRAVAEPSRQAAGLAEDLRRQAADAANQAAGIPLVGDGLRQPLDGMAGTLGDLAASASGQVAAIEQTATVAGALAFVIPVAIILILWVPRRLAFARRAAEVRALVDTADGTDLLALRALATQPIDELRSIGADPVAAWRAGDPHAMAALAELELVRAGVRRRRRPRAAVTRPV